MGNCEETGKTTGNLGSTSDDVCDIATSVLSSLLLYMTAVANRIKHISNKATIYVKYFLLLVWTLLIINWQ